MKYCNFRHGYSVNLPIGTGVNQRGENMIGGHGNEFYNADTTLVVSVYGKNYDAILVDTLIMLTPLLSMKKIFLTRPGFVQLRSYQPVNGYRKDE